MGWLNKFFNLLNALAKLSTKEKFLVIEAWMELLRVVLILRTPMRLRLFESNIVSKKSSGGKTDSIQIASLVNAVASHHIKKITCLERVIALQKILGRRGLPTHLCIGVGTNKEQFDAHAWLESPTLPLDNESPNFKLLNPAKFNSNK